MNDEMNLNENEMDDNNYNNDNMGDDNNDQYTERISTAKK
jgi:hypothetical protein